MVVSEDDFPCSSLAVDSFLRLGWAGSAWGLFVGKYEAGKKAYSVLLYLGLKGATRASYVVKSVGRYGTYCGVFAALFAATRCGIRRYRSENDWVNPCIAGAVTGAAFALRSRSFQQILSTSAIVAAIATAADYSTAI